MRETPNETKRKTIFNSSVLVIMYECVCLYEEGTSASVGGPTHWTFRHAARSAGRTVRTKGHAASMFNADRARIPAVWPGWRGRLVCSANAVRSQSWCRAAGLWGVRLWGDTGDTVQLFL